MKADSLIYVAGHKGLVGSAVVSKLLSLGHQNLVLPERDDLDLTDQTQVDAFMTRARPDYLFLCAAKVGGIHANRTFPAEFIRDNLAIQTNLIHSAYRHGVRKLLFLGSSCIYPRDSSQPMREDSLLSGPLEETNQWYAVAKIAGLKMCQAYRRQYGFDAICAMPTNLYGPGDNFHPDNSHVVPGLLRRFHEAREHQANAVTVWGSGSPLRELMHVDDLADALIFLMENYSDERPINVGSGHELSIRELAILIASVTGYTGEIGFDASLPDGAPRKLLDSSAITALGWRPGIDLRTGLARTYESYSKRVLLVKRGKGEE